MKKDKKTLLKVNLILEYYKNKNKNIIDRYKMLISDRLVIDNECLDILDNANEKLYITPLSKINKNKE